MEYTHSQTVLEIDGGVIRDVYNIPDPADVGSWFKKSKYNPEAGNMNCIWVTVAALLGMSVPQLRKETGISQDFSNGTSPAQLQDLLKRLNKEFVAYNVDPDGQISGKADFQSAHAMTNNLPNKHGIWYVRNDNSAHSVVRELQLGSGDMESRSSLSKFKCYQADGTGEDVQKDVEASTIFYVFYIVDKAPQGYYLK